MASRGCPVERLKKRGRKFRYEVHETAPTADRHAQHELGGAAVEMVQARLPTDARVRAASQLLCEVDRLTHNAYGSRGTAAIGWLNMAYDANVQDAPPHHIVMLVRYPAVGGYAQGWRSAA